MMLIVPASKVSVPLTVVMRTRSSVPERVIEPLHKEESAEFEFPIIPEPTQILVPKDVSTRCPFIIAVATMPPVARKANPEAKVLLLVFACHTDVE